MRKILVLAASVLMLIALPANGHLCGDTQCVSCSKGNPEYRRHGHHYHPKYFIGKNGVYFGNMPVEGASKCCPTVMLWTAGMFITAVGSWRMRR